MMILFYKKPKIDYNIINELKFYGYNLENAEKCIKSKKHNKITTTYYLQIYFH